ncbi:MAG: AAA family ATPase [Actinobacteria bacterium]|nr:AAA family ATPase [Actinomycetota bacterium]
MTAAPGVRPTPAVPARAAQATARPRDLTAVVRGRRLIVCTGSGGVGKTTTAAALALGAARRGRRTVVLTIDPARRLAQSLGLRALDNSPRPVRGVEGLHAMQLDMKRTFDDVVERYAPDPARAARIRSNRFYEQLSSSLAGTQEYMAMEKLHGLHVAGEWDCIVVDTPPTRHALDFLDAPRRLTDFLEGRLLKVFLAPGLAAGKTLGRAVGLGTGLFMRAASRITGSQVLDDLGGFFQAFEGMYDGFKRRAQSVYGLLQEPGSAFVVIAGPEVPALREARFFLRRLQHEGMPTAGVVVNRTTPPPDPALAGLDRGAVAAAAARLDGGVAERTTAQLLRLHLDRVDVVAREQRTIAAALRGLDPPALVQVPLMDSDIHDLGGLAAVGRYLYQDG